MSIEQKINYQLNKYPAVKKVIKRAYQRTMYAISPKIKSEGNITRISPDDKEHEYFFGYYDKSPWDITDRYMLCLRANDTWSDVSPKETADILLIDTEKKEDDKDRVKKIAETRAWNVQQSCMLQWLGPDFSSRVLYNDYRDGKYVSVILTFATMEEKVITAPVYSVSADGRFALTLDFSRLYNLRPGYGYYNVSEKTKGVALPDTTAIWKVDLETGEVTEFLKYTDFANFQPRSEMQEAGAVHKVNHIMLSPSGKRFMVLYRWFIGERKYTRLITCNVDGTNMYVLSDDDMVSHCFWKDDEHIIAFENKKKSGTGYYLMKDKTQEYVHCWPEMTGDGHPSYSPDRSLVVTDSYPDRARMASLRVINADIEKNDVKVVAKVFAPFKYDNDTRCDLHPRWNHAGDKICFDSVFEGHRGLYIVDVSNYKKPVVNENVENDNHGPRYSIITPMYNSFSMMDRYFESFRNQTYKNFEIIIVDDCSTDDSYEKLVEYSKNSPLNINILRNEVNSGPGVARTKGLYASTGDYVTFIDNDDWVDTSLLHEISSIIISQSVNCVIYDLYAKTEKNCSVMDSMYSCDEGKQSLEDAMRYTRNHSVGKVYKRECLISAGIEFPALRRCEDVAFVCRAIEACNQVYYLKKSLYYYYQRPASLSNNKSMDQSDMVRAFAILEETIGKKYPEVIETKSVTDLLYGGVLMMCKASKSFKEVRKYIIWYENKYPNWYKSPIIYKLGSSKRLFLKFIKSKNIIMLKLLAIAHSILVKG